MHPALGTAFDRVAAREGREATALPPLYEAVDPESLTALLESPSAVTVRFAYAGYVIVIGPSPHEVEVIGEDR
ncbi:HalOD1 output domain-containing protein [Natrarchaeobius oligotrophus]|uniref:Halobacterial output domain-containing protein n=1 Tax=Natrarchaeobius chitinivorans TaxID=1679083 RepID=A0A3N6PD13_NATCH|nr:HalOD1 output domain-containing protein [Natrarchaeobius chitinivorans]RQG94795.1 hypothetical protein EA472_22055 [Natrarchaeobius chitinivorans]